MDRVLPTVESLPAATPPGAPIAYLLHPEDEGVIRFHKGQLIFHHRKDHGITTKCLNPLALQTACQQAPLDSGWIAPHTVRCGWSARGEWILLKFPPRRYTLTIPTAKTRRRGPQTERLRVPLPGLLFGGINNNYYVWAYTGTNLAPSHIFHAPLPNIWEDGRICFGTNKQPLASSTTIQQTWELFLSSPFSAELGEHRLHSQENDVFRFLRALHHAKTRKFPTRALRPQHRSLSHIIEETFHDGKATHDFNER